MKQFITKPDSSGSSKETLLQGLLDQLTDNQIPPQQSVRIVLSKALWLDIPKHDAIQAVLESAVARHFQNNPHSLFALWDEMSSTLQPIQ
jgi:hypothetical protein